MVRVGPETYKRLQNDSSCIRNICIVAHVDHGKTSLSDSLLASNGIISQRLAGRIRYLDSRPDEQLRGITMESSAISLYFRVLHKQENSDEPLVNEHLINLIDSPGHIDFSSEVSTASRLCDGAVVLVDVVEGVCSQTITVLRQCWIEKLKPVLVLNKIDRLITELRLTPQEAYIHLSKVIEQVNSVIGSFFAGERQLDDYSWREQLEQNENAEYVEKDDSDIYFDPKSNNVIFASAVDGWGFNVGQLAKFYEQKLGAKRENLQKVLWGDFYMDPKTKKIINNKSLKGRNLKPLFVSLILDNIWKIYESIIIERDDDAISKITNALNIKLMPRDLRSKDNKQLLRTVISQWLPVSTAVLLTVIEKLPSPVASQRDRLDTILGDESSIENVDQSLIDAMKICDRNGPTSAYVSKIISIPREELPITIGDETSPDAIMARSRRAREDALNAARRAELAENMAKMEITESNKESNGNDLYKRAKDTIITPELEEDEPTKGRTEKKKTEETFQIVTEAAPALDLGIDFQYEEPEDDEVDDGGLISDFIPTDIDPNDPMNALFEYEEEDPFAIPISTEISVQYEEEEEEDLFDEKDEVLVGFARIYSGALQVGQEISVLGPKYDPKHPTEHIQTTTITNLYLFMGKELVPLDYCPAGNIVGIRGLAGKILKNGTLIQKGINGINLAGVNLHSTPIVQVAVEAVNPGEMHKLVRGLKLLEQADPCVETYVADNGEHILCTAGELHLERCLKDLQERFAGIEISRSDPAIPYRETFLSTSDMNPTKNAELGRGVTESLIGKYKMRVRTIPLIDEVTSFLDNNSSSINHLFGNNNNEGVVREGLEKVTLSRESFIKKFEHVLEKDEKNKKYFSSCMSKLVTFGPKRTGCNILLSENNLLSSLLDNTSGKFEYADPLINGFQLSVNEGPLANEPVQGMCIIVEDIHEMSEDEINAIEDPHYQTDIPDISGKFITQTRDQIHESFLDWSPRIMWAMYTCDIQTSVEVLGKVYAVVQQRQGKIVSEEMKEGTPFFQIVAEIPVVEAFGLSEDIRKKTSGAAQPQLVFSGFESIDLDPFWVPTTEEELEDLGDIADKENIARRHMNMIRRRKGLFVEEKVIQNAEKQRTLKRN